MAKLTRKEQAWIDELQAVLDRCPSKRLGFYTTGDPMVTVFDYTMDEAINAEMDSRSCHNDFGPAAEHLDANFCYITFPNPVHSTAG